MRPSKIGVIAGMELPKLFDEGETETMKIGTPYGPSTPISTGLIGDKTVALLYRHGEGHFIPPHRINFKANLWALHSLGVARIISVNNAGSLKKTVKPGTLSIPNDIIDFTRRGATFYDEPPVIHIDVTEPFCRELRRILLEMARGVGGRVLDGGVLVCTEGPRFETPAEIRMFQLLKGDLVGMTIAPEVFLAKELEMCYASVAMVTNRAAGLQRRVTAEEVLKVSNKHKSTISRIVRRTIMDLPSQRRCGCSSALEGARV